MVCSVDREKRQSPQGIAANDTVDGCALTPTTVRHVYEAVKVCERNRSSLLGCRQSAGDDSAHSVGCPNGHAMHRVGRGVPRHLRGHVGLAKTYVSVPYICVEAGKFGPSLMDFAGATILIEDEVRSVCALEQLVDTTLMYGRDLDGVGVRVLAWRSRASGGS
jgi:hypothetical protein